MPDPDVGEEGGVGEIFYLRLAVLLVDVYEDEVRDYLTEEERVGDCGSDGAGTYDGDRSTLG